MTAATIAPAQESAAKLPTPKLPSNPFAGKQYLGLILPLALIALWYILSTNGVFTQVQLPSSWRSAVSWPSTSRFRPSAC